MHQVLPNDLDPIKWNLGLNQLTVWTNKIPFVLECNNIMLIQGTSDLISVRY